MKMPMIALALSMVSAPALAATFVYVSNAEDGTIGMYTLQADGSLQPGARVEAAKVVMPMAVSPDKRFLIAAVRSKPYEAYTYAIDKKSGALKLVGKGPLAESYPYITIDRTGRFLLGASYGAHQVGVNPIGKDGKVGEPIQVIPTARNAHAIRTDNTNRFVFVPHLGTDQMFQFVLDKKSGKLSANTPPVVQLKQGTGPRHIIVSKDNKFVYLLNELNATVTTLALDAKTGTLKEVELGLRAAGRHQARPRRAARRRRRARTGSAQHRQRHLGLGPAPHAERPLPLCGRAHVEHARRLQGRCGEREAQLCGKHADREAAARLCDRSERQVRGGVGREVGHDLDLCDRRRDRRAQADRKYPTGKGSNWVEIVSFD